VSFGLEGDSAERQRVGDGVISGGGDRDADQGHVLTKSGFLVFNQLRLGPLL
jgi:hypothetical protein